MTVIQIAKALLQGEQIEGWTLNGDVLSDGSHWWTVHSSSRVTIDEIPDPATLPILNEKPKIPRYFKKICKDCGNEFVISKYHGNRQRCTICDRNFRRETGEDRAKICLRCGNEFYISKFKPYTDPQYCPKCGQVLRARAFQKKQKSEGTFYERHRKGKRK